MTRSSCAARWLRRGTIVLTMIGCSLLGWVLAAKTTSGVYQARQERAFTPVLQPEMLHADDEPGVQAVVDPLVLGRIEIPRLGVAAIVREGTDDTTLAIAVGHISGTAGPGERGNMALAGHRDSFFRPLRDIRLQDRIRIVTRERAYEYTVDSTAVVAPEDTAILDPTSDTVLSLVTCYPFHYVGHAPNRFVVRASLVALAPAATAGRGGSS